MNSTHLIIAYYHLVPLCDPQAEIQRHKSFFQKEDIMARVYISEEGINCQMSAEKSSGERYMTWMQQRPEFADIFYKIDPHHEHVFPKQTVKYRNQLVAFDVKADYAKAGEHLSPKAWQEMLETSEAVVLDVRNDYEWNIGHFRGAECPPCHQSRDFIAYAKQLKEKIDPKKTPIMMYCTGGIRCETFSALLKEDGFEKVYQLQGGVINYGHQQGSKHWQGKLFVFDDRMAVPLTSTSTDDATPIGKCHHCQQPNDTYYNCANMECNHLFLCCPTCLKQFAGCCAASCQTAPRVRPYHETTAHKPFRKWYTYWKEKQSKPKQEAYITSNK